MKKITPNTGINGRREQPTPLAGMFDPEPGYDPLAEFVPTGDLEADTGAEASALLTAFKKKAEAEQSRFELATDSEFWFAVCFQSREQKEAFLKAISWLSHGDKYLDGLTLAGQMGITLPRVTLPKPRKSTRFAKLATNLGKLIGRG